MQETRGSIQSRCKTLTAKDDEAHLVSIIGACGPGWGAATTEPTVKTAEYCTRCRAQA